MRQDCISGLMLLTLVATVQSLLMRLLLTQHVAYVGPEQQQLGCAVNGQVGEVGSEQRLQQK
jgi:hypothetical protein